MNQESDQGLAEGVRGMKGNYRVASILADRERGCRQCRRALQTVSLECLRIGDAGSQGG